MDDQRVGAALRAVRIRRGWRQADVARRARVSASVVSLIERGHLNRVSFRALRAVAAAHEVLLTIGLRLPHGELDRILNADHAALHESVARYLADVPGWFHAAEVSFVIYGERGIIDILAFHEPTDSLLVIELKTELVSLEDLLSTMDVRMRHARAIARDRGWTATSVSAWVVVIDAQMNRRRVRMHRTLLRTAFPLNGRDVRRWVRAPSGSVRALSLWSNSTDTNGTRTPRGRRRVRVARDASKAA